MTNAISGMLARPQPMNGGLGPVRPTQAAEPADDIVVRDVETRARPISGLALPLVPMAGLYTGRPLFPTQASMYRYEELQREVAEDLVSHGPAVHEAMRQAGLDIRGSVALRSEADGSVTVDGDHFQRKEIEAFFASHPEERRMVAEYISKTGVLASMNVVNGYLGRAEALPSDAERGDLWQKEWSYRVIEVGRAGGRVIMKDGRFQSPSLERANALLAEARPVLGTPGKRPITEGAGQPDGLMRTIYGNAFDPAIGRIDGKMFQEMVGRETAALEQDLAGFMSAAGLAGIEDVRFGIGEEGNLQIINEFPERQKVELALVANPALIDRLRDNLHRQEERETFAIGGAYASAVRDSQSDEEIMAAWHKAVAAFGQSVAKTELRWDGGHLTRV